MACDDKDIVYLSGEPYSLEYVKASCDVDQFIFDCEQGDWLANYMKECGFDEL